MSMLNITVELNLYFLIFSPVIVEIPFAIAPPFYSIHCPSLEWPSYGPDSSDKAMKQHELTQPDGQQNKTGLRRLDAYLYKPVATFSKSTLKVVKLLWFVR